MLYLLLLCGRELEIQHLTLHSASWDGFLILGVAFSHGGQLQCEFPPCLGEFECGFVPGGFLTNAAKLQNAVHHGQLSPSFWLGWRGGAAGAGPQPLQAARAAAAAAAGL